MGIVERRQDPPFAPGARSLDEFVLQARMDLADGLAAAISAERLGPGAYLRWIASEHALAIAGAAALAGIAARTQGPLRDWAQAASAMLRAQAAMAAADVRRTDGVAATTGIIGLDHWRDYYELHAFARPWRVLGAVVLHASAMDGPAAAPVSAVLGLPFLSVRGATYLLHRQLQARVRTEDLARLRRLLPDAAAGQDLLEGAAFAAASYRGIGRAVLGAPAPSGLAARWRFAPPRLATTGVPA